MNRKSRKWFKNRFADVTWRQRWTSLPAEDQFDEFDGNWNERLPYLATRRWGEPSGGGGMTIWSPDCRRRRVLRRRRSDHGEVLFPGWIGKNGGHWKIQKLTTSATEGSGRLGDDARRRARPWKPAAGVEEFLRFLSALISSACVANR